MRIDIAGGVPVLASSREVIERSESVAQPKVDGGSDRLILACESGLTVQNKSQS